MPGKKKKISFADELQNLLDSRAPKEIDIDGTNRPELDEEQDWNDSDHDEAEELLKEFGAQNGLRMRGDLSSAFTEGKYKGKVVDSNKAFGDESDSFEEDMEEEGEEVSSENDSSEESEQLKESKRDLASLRKKTEREAATRQGDYPTEDLESQIDSDDEDEFNIYDRKSGKVDESAISAKMDDIFRGLEEDDSETEAKGETYETFVKQQRLETKRRKSKPAKRKHEDFEDEHFEEHDSDREEEDELLKQLQDLRQATDQSTKSLIKTAEADEKRSSAARAQYQVWSKLVACRIHLQQPVSWASRFPAFYSYDDYVTNNDTNQEIASEVSNEIADLLESFHELRMELLRMNPSLKSGGALPVPTRSSQSAKRRKIESQSGVNLDRLWKLCVASHSQVAGKIDESLDYWHGRAMMQSAMSAEPQLKATTPASKQIHDSLKRESERLIHKAQKNRSRKLPIGHPDSDKVKANPVLMETPEYLRLEDIYDDSDFYSWLLTDFMHNCAEAKGIAPAELADAQRLAKDPGRLLIDKKRSKARKLSFEPHQKLVGFQVPIPQEIPSYVDSLYTTLFATV